MSKLHLWLNCSPCAVSKQKPPNPLAALLRTQTPRPPRIPHHCCPRGRTRAVRRGGPWAPRPERQSRPAAPLRLGPASAGSPRGWGKEPARPRSAAVCVCPPLDKGFPSTTPIRQGAVTEFVESLPTKTSTFSGDASGDVLMCTCFNF